MSCLFSRLFDFLGNICSSSRNTRTASKQISHMTTSQHQSGNGSVSQNSVSVRGNFMGERETNISLSASSQLDTVFPWLCVQDCFFSGHTNISFSGRMQLSPGLERKHWFICRVATQRIRAGFPGSFVPRLLVPGFRGSIPARLRILRRPARAPILQLSSGSGQEAEGYE